MSKSAIAEVLEKVLSGNAENPNQLPIALDHLLVTHRALKDIPDVRLAPAVDVLAELIAKVNAEASRTKMKLFAVVYENRYGSSVRMVKSRLFPSVEAVVAACGIDFDESDERESISVDFIANEDELSEALTLIE